MREPTPHGHPLWELTLARFREFIREPGAVFWTFGFPVLLAVGLGVAFRGKPPEAIQAAVVGTDPVDRRVASILYEAESVDLWRMDAGEAASALRTGKIDILVEPDSDGGELSVTYRYDTLRPQGRTAPLTVDSVLQSALGRVDVIETHVKTVSEPGGRYIDFLIPGLIGLNVMGSSMWGIGYAVVLARRRKLLKRLAATPMRRSHFMLSYMLSRLVFLLMEVALLTAFGWIVFGVAVHGSLAWLLVVSLLGASTFTGLALLVASRAESTEVAAGIMNAVMLPMWLLSGSFFSYERFPEVVHPAIRLLPLTAFNDALRLVVNEGAPLWAAWWELSVLACWALVSTLLAIRLFRWQ